MKMRVVEIVKYKEKIFKIEVFKNVRTGFFKREWKWVPFIEKIQDCEPDGYEFQRDEHVEYKTLENAKEVIERMTYTETGSVVFYN